MLLLTNVFKKEGHFLDTRLTQTSKSDVEMSSRICWESLFDYNRQSWNILRGAGKHQCHAENAQWCSLHLSIHSIF